jgi:catechol 2,3-dioxygenase-like lactoylglutathione lyase family enzyme
VLRLGTIVLGADDPDRAVAFWSQVLGYDVVPVPDEPDDFSILVPPDRVGTRVGVHRSSTPVQERPRVHLDLVVDSAAEQTAEVERLLALGASRVPWDHAEDSDSVVLADTEGNRFCVVDASHG